MSFPLLAVNIGQPRTASFKGKEAVSGIFKNPAAGSVELGMGGLAGDGQADLVHHGGPDKAVCVYSHVHYPHWEQVIGRKMAFGAFGENLTLDVVTESDVQIGDVFRIGTAVVQISQPRVPCWKLAMKWGLDELPKLVTESGATGFYLRVLEPGSIRAGHTIEALHRHAAGVTVAEANRVMHRDKDDLEGIRRLLELRLVLAESWIASLDKRLSKLQLGG